MLFILLSFLPLFFRRKEKREKRKNNQSCDFKSYLSARSLKVSKFVFLQLETDLPLICTVKKSLFSHRSETLELLKGNNVTKRKINNKLWWIVYFSIYILYETLYYLSSLTKSWTVVSWNVKRFSNTKMLKYLDFVIFFLWF